MDSYSKFHDEVYKQDPAFADMPETFIQWKGTEVCMDIHCSCGLHSHLDEEFAYFFRCGCGVTYALGHRVRMIRLSEEQVAFLATDRPNLIKTARDET